MKRIDIKRIRLLQIAFLSFFLFVTFSCSKESEDPELDKRGDLVTSAYISGYSTNFISALLNNSGVNIDIDIKYDVDAYKITYFTPKPNGQLLIASGTIMVPLTISEFPVICFQHGTETKRSQVPSTNPLITDEGIASLISASMGFVIFFPDYLGFGVSEILHPYLHAKLSSGTITDMLRAGESFCRKEEISLNKDLYIGGYSEGGFITLATQKEIEKQSSFPFELIASAPQAGPYDLLSTVNYFIDEGEYPEPAFMAYLLTSYNEIYGWNRLSDIFKSPYSSMIPNLFDGTKTIDEINSELPSKVSNLFKEPFLTGIRNGTEEDVIDALKENTLLSWTPITTTRFYHCRSDEVVPYQNSLTAIQKFKANGAGRIELVTYEEMTHSEASLKAIPDMILWFDSLRVSR